MYGEGRPAWAVRLMTHELAQPTPALDGVVAQMIRPRYDALRGLVGRILGRPIDDRVTRLCAQSILGQVVIYAHGREVIKRVWADLKLTPEALDAPVEGRKVHVPMGSRVDRTHQTRLGV